MKMFLLGVHHISWLSQLEIPVCVSYARLAGRLRYPPKRPNGAATFVDSGAFSIVSRDGEWRSVPATRYAAYLAEISRPEYGLNIVGAGIQDYMCEDEILNGLVRRKNSVKKGAIDVEKWKAWARQRVASHGSAGLSASLHLAEELGDAAEVVIHGTGLSVEEHQHLTIRSYETLTALAPSVKWWPTLQGKTPDDYVHHIEMWRTAGHEAALQNRVVGLGSVCRRQRTSEIEAIMTRLSKFPYRYHGYGVKKTGLEKFASVFWSSDSMAWSQEAFRKHIILPGCQHGTRLFRRRLGREEYGNCANCLKFAVNYYNEMKRRFVDEAA
jgi:hypothetical protein